jgi:hypothetical protein
MDGTKRLNTIHIRIQHDKRTNKNIKATNSRAQTYAAAPHGATKRECAFSLSRFFKPNRDADWEEKAMVLANEMALIMLPDT